MKRTTGCLVATCLLGATAAPLPAQGGLGIGPIAGASFDRVNYGAGSDIAFSYRRSRLTGRGPAVRLDVSRHRFYSDNVIARFWTIGIGLATLPPAAGAGPR